MSLDFSDYIHGLGFLTDKDLKENIKKLKRKFHFQTISLRLASKPSFSQIDGGINYEQIWPEIQKYPTEKIIDKNRQRMRFQTDWDGHYLDYILGVHPLNYWEKRELEIVDKYWRPVSMSRLATSLALGIDPLNLSTRSLSQIGIPSLQRIIENHQEWLKEDKSHPTNLDYLLSNNELTTLLKDAEHLAKTTNNKFEGILPTLRRYEDYSTKAITEVYVFLPTKSGIKIMNGVINSTPQRQIHSNEHHVIIKDKTSSEVIKLPLTSSFWMHQRDYCHLWPYGNTNAKKELRKWWNSHLTFTIKLEKEKNGNNQIPREHIPIVYFLKMVEEYGFPPVIR